MNVTLNRNPIIIVGAGVAGLTLAYKLVQSGLKVVVVEREPLIGGLARSYRYDGFTFDIGPHRFHTDDREVLDFIHSILASEKIVIARRSGVYMFDKYFDWPLGTSSLFKLPLKIMLRSFFDLLSKSQASDPESFTDYTISRYGKTLYRSFFKYYTEKFILIPCEEVHVDWATAGINRAVIDKRVQANSLFDLVKGVLLPKKVDTHFIYPLKPGVDNFAHKIARTIRESGSEIFTDTVISEIVQQDGEIKQVKLSNGRVFDPDRLVWSGELHSLANLLKQGPFPLKYLSMICYNVAIKGHPEQQYQWIYYGDKKATINRVTLTHLFNPANAPSGFSGINAEITCMEGDQIWKNPESMLAVVNKDLIDTKLIRRKEAIQQIWIERVRNTYPVYDRNYKKNLTSAIKELSRYKNLLLLGRCGTFWYNNMDHSMKMAMDYANHILTGKELAGKDAYFVIN